MPRRPDQPRPADIADQHATTDQLPAAGCGSAADQPLLPERRDPSSRESLRRRLDGLPAWHPSSSAQDARGRPERLAGTREAQPASGHCEPTEHGAQVADIGPHRDARADKRPRPDPLTDTEHADRVRDIRDRLDQAREHGLATDQQHMADRKRGIWSQERRDAHDAIVGDLYTAAADVPCEHKAIMAGGLGGAGKSTVLDSHAGIDRSRYLTINPDGIKAEMARRGLIPKLDGLSPMEASDLVHEESSHVAYLLAARALKDGKNIIWDITMSKTRTTEQRLDDLDRAGFATSAVFVRIGIGEAVQRADARHRSGHEEYRAGIGFGGRYVPPEVIRAQADPEWGSRNRRTFEQVKARFTDWAVYDNSVTGRDPQLIQTGYGAKREDER